MYVETRRKSLRIMPDDIDVEIDDVPIEGVESVRIPALSTEPGELDGFGETRADDLEIERVLSSSDPDSSLWEWKQAVEEGDDDDGHRQVAVYILDDEGEIVVLWEFEQAWIKYYGHTELDQDGSGALREQVSIDFEAMGRETP